VESHCTKVNGSILKGLGNTSGLLKKGQGTGKTQFRESAYHIPKKTQRKNKKKKKKKQQKTKNKKKKTHNRLEKGGINCPDSS